MKSRTKSAKPKKVQTAFGISEYILPNGLRVLYKQVKAAPVVAVCVTFHVGSRNEGKGHTGATHILEHLLFKDSKKFNRKNGNAITDYLDWFGARINATTWLDRTNYFEVLPKARLEAALELEADRMRDSLFSSEDLASEMTVVRNEYERTRNNPFEVLDEEVMWKTFSKHPYRIPTIGLKEDIEGSSVKKLREFYNTFYWPNNATLAVFGDVEWSRVERLVMHYFAPIPRSPRPIPKLAVIEPAQKSARAVRLSKPFGISLAELMYKIPAGEHADFPAVLLLGMVLGGGLSSRLQRALVDTGLASELRVMCPALHDGGFISFTAHCADAASPKKVLEIMRTEIAGLAHHGVEKEEIARAKEALLSQFSFERDGVYSEILAVSESIAAGDWRLSYNMEKKLSKITSAQLVRVAKKYLTPVKATSGILTS